MYDLLYFSFIYLFVYLFIHSFFFFLLSADCADGWHRFRTGCIKFFTTSLTRIKAKEKCNEFETSNQIKGTLIKIPSSDDNDQVVSLSPTSGAYTLAYQ